MKGTVVCKKEFTEGLYQYSVRCSDYIEGADEIQRVLNSRKVGKEISVQERKLAMLQINSLANGLAFCWTANYSYHRKKVVQKVVRDARKAFPGKNLHMIDRIKVLVKACIKLSEKEVQLDYIGYQNMDAIYALVIAYQNIIQVDEEEIKLVKQYFRGISVGRTLLRISKEEYNVGDEYNV